MEIEKVRNVFYVVGAYGSGKSTLVKRISKDRWSTMTISEGSDVMHMLASKDPEIQIYSYIPYLYMKMKFWLDFPFMFYPPVLVVDGHPALSVAYQNTFSRLGMMNSFESDGAFKSLMFYNKMDKYMHKTLLKGVNECIIYLDIPFEDHWSQVQARYKERQEDFEEEFNQKYLQTIRDEVDDCVDLLNLPTINIKDPNYTMEWLVEEMKKKAK